MNTWILKGHYNLGHWTTDMSAVVQCLGIVSARVALLRPRQIMQHKRSMQIRIPLFQESPFSST